MNYNMINQELIPSYYHILVDVTVIHRKITRIQDITLLGNTPIYRVNLAEDYRVKAPPLRAPSELA